MLSAVGPFLNAIYTPILQPMGKLMLKKQKQFGFLIEMNLQNPL